MSTQPADRRKGWTPLPRPEWVQRLNEEGSYMDMRGVVPLDEDSLLATAKRNTGLSNFGAEDWYEPFQVLIKSLDTEAALHMAGRLMAREDILMFLEGRLWIEDTYKKHPEIDDEQIIKPLLLTGQGRSGTTGLQHLLSADPKSRVPMTWEALFPYPPPETATFHTDSRILKAVNRFEIYNRVVPEIVSMHDFKGDIATENIHLQGMSFQSPMWFNLLGQVPTYNAYMARRGVHTAYRYEKRILKYLQWKCPGDRWMQKTPVYADHLPEVMEVFPDAQFIWIHRDPVKALSSMVTLAGVTNRARSDRSFIGAVADQFGDIESFLSAEYSSMRLNRAIDWIEAGVLPKKQLCNIHYADFVADPLGTVKKIYDFHSIRVPQSSFDAMQKHIDDRARLRASRTPYTYDVGSVEQISKERAYFKRYQEYFSVPNEV